MTGSTDGRQQRRAAENQALFREINEQIQKLDNSVEELTPYRSWTCECADTACLERIDMTPQEYETVRSHPARFAVCPDEEHVFAGVELITERTERYWVVEKIEAAAEAAAELDPRAAR
jgi:hypothetical protein